MIVRLTGTVSEVSQDRAVIDHDGIGYEVLICGHSTSELTEQIGLQVTLHTMEYFEGSSAGGNLIPRLIGFLHTEDRTFFERFITVKNIGVRKALKALTGPISSVATAIESGDTQALSLLPGIGKRAATQIIAELKGKVADFALGATELGETPATVTDGWTSQQHDALKVMVALGERQTEAQRWLERAIRLHPGTRGPDDWIRLAYRIKSSEG